MAILYNIKKHFYGEIAIDAIQKLHLTHEMILNARTNDNPLNGKRNNIACKTKKMHFGYVCFPDKKRDFATDDNIRFNESIK